MGDRARMLSGIATGGLHQPVRPNRNRLDGRQTRSPEFACHRSRGPFLDVQQRKTTEDASHSSNGRCQPFFNAKPRATQRGVRVSDTHFPRSPLAGNLNRFLLILGDFPVPRAIHSRRAAGARHHAISGHDPFHDVTLRQNSRRTSRTRVAGRVIQAYSISAYGLK